MLICSIDDDPSLLQYDTYSVVFVMASPPKTRSMLLVMATMVVATIVIIIIQVQANTYTFMAVPSMAQPALEIVVLILVVIILVVIIMKTAGKLRMTTIIGRMPTNLILFMSAIKLMMPTSITAMCTTTVTKMRPKSWITSLTIMIKRTSSLLPTSSVVMRMRIMLRVGTTTKLMYN